MSDKRHGGQRQMMQNSRSDATLLRVTGENCMVVVGVRFSKFNLKRHGTGHLQYMPS